ncbi:hypothetical protein SRABI98_01801 [Microbacterium sp. Bi98]|nr:hypothetical protein SRABI98_01801 [Microbacterium sp. Bi98]
MRATAIVTVIVASSSWGSWWRGVGHPPPASWAYMFEDFTGEDSADEWGLAAGIFIAQYRRRQSQGPTFRELFEHLLPDTGGVPARLPTEWDVLERRRGNSSFRSHVAIEWRRRGYIEYDRQVTRSLRVGHRFREQSRALQAQPRESNKALGGARSPTATDASEHSLSAVEARALLRVAPTSLRRLTRRGYLHVVECDSEWRYPSWQFAGRPRFAVVPGIDIVAPAIPKDWSPATINSFMMTPRRELADDGGSVSPADWLIRGSDPHQIADFLETLEVESE